MRYQLHKDMAARQGPRLGLLRFLFFYLVILIAVTVIYLVYVSISLALLAFFDYRIEGWGAAAQSVAVLILGPICLLTMAVFLFHWLMHLGERNIPLPERRVRPRKAPFSVFSLGLGMVAIGLPYVLFIAEFVVPTVAFDERMHLKSWPSELSLRRLAVCPTRLYPAWQSTNADGEIFIDLVNTSDRTIEKGIFTVETGRVWMKRTYGARIIVENLQPRERRRIVLHEYLGKIIGRDNRNRPRDYDATIYWDALYFSDRRAPALIQRPANAQFRMGSCLPEERHVRPR